MTMTTRREAMALISAALAGTTLGGRANLFVFPNIDAANITYNMIRVMTDGAALGPILMGLSAPVHVMTSTATPRRVVNMTAIAAVEAQIRAARRGDALDRREGDDAVDDGRDEIADVDGQQGRHDVLRGDDRRGRKSVESAE